MTGTTAAGGTCDAEPAYSRHLVTEPGLGYRFEPAEANVQQPLPTRPHLVKVALADVSAFT